MIRTYEEARNFIKEASKRGSVLGLSGIRRLMEALGNVQETLPVVHIAGTNGKGSVGAYLASIFRQAGLHVGRYVSPAVFDPLEVWQYDGQNISKEEYTRILSQVETACGIVAASGNAMPTVFEIETALAFVWFSEKKPDVLLLETGMGGETDATNLVQKPLASVITGIGKDHMQFLGDSLSQIAKAKAGIIKEGCPVFSAAQKPEVKKVLVQTAEKCHAPLTFVKESHIAPVSLSPERMEFTYTLSEGQADFRLATSMVGSFQRKNAALAIETAFALLGTAFAGGCSENRLELITDGIREARWQGRFEIIGTQPLFVADGAHNEDAARELAQTVQNCFTNMPLTYIIGVLADKEHKKMLRLMLPYAECVYTVTPENPRALPAEKLAEEARLFHSNVTACSSIGEAAALARERGNTILAFGSLSYLGALKEAYRRQEKSKTDESRNRYDR